MQDIRKFLSVVLEEKSGQTDKQTKGVHRPLLRGSKNNISKSKSQKCESIFATVQYKTVRVFGKRT